MINCGTTTDDCYCYGKDPESLITEYATTDAGTLNADEWCTAWQEVLDENSKLPDKEVIDDGEDEDEVTPTCTDINIGLDGKEIFDADGDPWGCDWYADNPGSCGAYDTVHFRAEEMCCGCVDE